MTLALLVEQLFNGVQFGLMLFLMAVGVTLVFGIMRVINLAHGSLFMLGGYFLMAALTWTNSYALAIPLAFLAAALVAIALEIIVLRPLYRRGPLDQVLATFGLTLFFNEAVTVIWGREPIPLSIPSFLTGSVEIIPGGAYPIYRLVITAVAVEVTNNTALGIKRNVEIRWLPIPVEYNVARKTYLEAKQRPDGIYIPCGGWGSIHNIDLLERDLDTTVVTWMNAMIWSALRRGKVSGAIHGFGKLLASL